MPRPTRYHHVAFGTKDIEKTVDFYQNRLGLELSSCENQRFEAGEILAIVVDRVVGA